ncbi:MAG: S9 family peptidase [Sphingomonadales bacterium]|nr:S9 family peptidase [Sphingomonadales bacterium]MBD3773406.1 S9 family peptidase [Paracoccaceae bacterium]
MISSVNISARLLGRACALAIAVAATGSVTANPAFAQQAATTPGQEVAAKVPLDTLAALPALSDLRISPDGKRALATIGGGNNFFYAILDLEKGGDPKVFAQAATLKEEGERLLTDYRWINDRFVIFTLQSRENVYGQRVDLRRLASYDTQTGTTTPLAWRDATADASDILQVDRDNNRILLARMVDDGNSERRFLYQVEWVDVATGKVLEVVQRANPVVDGWAADGKGVIRMGFGSDRDSGQERYLYRSGASDTLHTVQKVKDEDFTGKGIRPIVFLDEPDMAIVSSNHEGYRAIYKANLATMEIVEKVFSVDGYDVGSAIPNEDENGILGYTYATDRPKRKWIDPDFATISQFLEEEFGEGNARIISRNKDSSRLIVSLSQPRQMDAYYLYDTKSGTFSLIGYESDKVKDGLLNPVEAIRYKASDGVEIEAIVTKPRLRQGEKNLPVVVLTHGGPYGVRDYAAYDQWAQSIAEQGYVVVQPNYRGSGGYGSEFVKEGRKDGFGTRMQDDLNDVVDYLASTGLVDPKRACMMGWSYGGYASARAAQRDPQRWRCTIAGAGVYDLPKMKAYDTGYLGSFGANYLAKGANSLIDVSPARNAGGTWAPILIVHGVRDPRVPIEQARTLKSALEGAGKKEGVDFAYLEQPLNGHYGVYFTKEERLQWLGGATAWLARFNPAYISSDSDYAKRAPLDPAAKAMADQLKIKGL